MYYINAICIVSNTISARCLSFLYFNNSNIWLLFVLPFCMFLFCQLVNVFDSSFIVVWYKHYKFSIVTRYICYRVQCIFSFLGREIKCFNTCEMIFRVVCLLGQFIHRLCCSCMIDFSYLFCHCLKNLSYLIYYFFVFQVISITTIQKLMYHNGNDLI